MTDVKPLAYGYMRVFCDMADEQVRTMELRMAAYAEEQGLRLAGIHHECDDGLQAVFNEVVEELQRTDVRHLILPSFRHLSRNELLQGAMLNQLESATKAEVHTLGSEDHRGDQGRRPGGE